MKVVILAGGFGTRLSEFTGKIPKPMVEIGDLPILVHIMGIYAAAGHKDFIIALGYKAAIIKEYFSRFHLTTNDYRINLLSGATKTLKKSNFDWNVTLVDTGLETMTGGRIKRLGHLIGKDDFLLTYGDGVSDVDINATIKLHKQEQRLLTMTAVRPTARFGEIKANGNKVTQFEEKPQLDNAWINGGFFVCENKILNFLKSDNEMFEREPIDRIMRNGGITIFKHTGFWQCMDSKRDYDRLNTMWNSGDTPWIT